MYPPAFDYHRADSVEDALELLAAADRDVRVLAGGHSLLPDLKAGETAPDAVVDLGRIDGLRSITETGDGVEIGAMVTYADLADSEVVRDRAPLVAAAAGKLGDRQIRNRGTIGGNLAYAHPGADLPPAALASGASLRIRSRDEARTVPAGEFFGPGGETDVGDSELITGIEVPDGSEGAATYRKWTHPTTGYAAVGVAASVVVEDGTVTEATAAATGVIDRAIRLPAAEDAVMGQQPSGATAGSAGDAATEDVDPVRLRSDPQVSAEYRQHRLGVAVRRALATAFERSGSGPVDQGPHGAAGSGTDRSSGPGETDADGGGGADE